MNHPHFHFRTVRLVRHDRPYEIYLDCTEPGCIPWFLIHVETDYRWFYVLTNGRKCLNVKPAFGINGIYRKDERLAIPSIRTIRRRWDEIVRMAGLE